ncbi:9672_t:CDS:2 [Ambispora leptoticha]|uniref:9672_t:CDS:1 n=1 Tax=Ambispora leptoticha TaxID=144679 RepID=A0A9N8W517_9GLOM|nr:9672_t:CDS:2 [Ambispora leptoticha]
MSSLPLEVAGVLKNFRTLNREQRKAFLQGLVNECDSYDFHTLQQCLKHLGMIGFDLLGALPVELSVKIFSHLDPGDLLTLHDYFFYIVEETAPTMNWEQAYQQLYRREKNWAHGRAQSVKILYGHEERINDAKLKENILVTGSTDRTVRVWDLDKEECLRVFKGNTFSSVDFLVKEKIVAAATFFRASFIWNMETGDLLQELTGHVSAVRVISLNETYVASCAFDGSIIIWIWKTGEKVATINTNAQDFRFLDNTIVALSNNNNKELNVYSLPEGTALFSIPFDNGLLGWAYFKNVIPKDQPTPQIILTPEMLEEYITLPANIAKLKSESPSSSWSSSTASTARAIAFDTRKGRVVRGFRDQEDHMSVSERLYSNSGSIILDLQLFDKVGQSSMVQFALKQSQPQDQEREQRERERTGKTSSRLAELAKLRIQSYTTVDMDFRIEDNIYNDDEYSPNTAASYNTTASTNNYNMHHLHTLFSGHLRKHI